MADGYDPELQGGIDAWNAVMDERAEAELEKRRAQREGDSAGVAYAQRRISACNAELRNLTADYNEYMARENPPAPAEPTREELMARPMDRMSHADMYRLLKGNTKHGIDDDGYLAGIREVAARRARGE